MKYVFDHVHLKSDDPKKTADWYVKAFNFQIIADFVRSFGDRMIQCKTENGAQVNISNARTGEELGPGDASAHLGLEHFGMRITDLDAELERLGQLGAPILLGPLEVPDGRIVFIEAPDRVRIELIETT